MEIGLCLSLEEAAGLPAEASDFIEVNVQSFLVPEADEAAWQANFQKALTGPPVRAANCFLPGNLKCIGPEIDGNRLLRYAEVAFRRAREVGIEVIVFGSGGARTLPLNFPREKALEQFVDLLKALGPLAEKEEIILTVEPLHSGECNFINSLAEGALAVTGADHSCIRLLADTYHMLMDSEPATQIVRFGSLLAHVHVAEKAERGWPGRASEDLQPFYTALREINYQGRASIECRWEDVARDGAASTQFLRGEFVKAGL